MRSKSAYRRCQAEQDLVPAAKLPVDVQVALDDTPVHCPLLQTAWMVQSAEQQQTRKFRQKSVANGSSSLDGSWRSIKANLIDISLTQQQSKDRSLPYL